MTNTLSSMTNTLNRFIQIDPKTASSILENQCKNRSVNYMTVKKYIKKMEANEWISNIHLNISFNKDNKLIDGQHRLLAVISCGKSQEFYCRFNVSSEQSIAEATSLNRTIADKLVMFTGFENNNATVAAAIGRLIFTRFKMGRVTTSGLGLTNHIFEHSEILDCFKLMQCDPNEIARESRELYLMQPIRAKVMMQSEIGYMLCQKSIGANQILYDLCSNETSNILACCIKKNILNRSTKDVSRRFSSLAFAKVYNNQKPLLKIQNLRGTPIPDLFDGNFVNIGGAA